MASRSESESGAVGERVKAAVGTVQEKARDVLEPAVDKARGKVGDFQASVADAAESGAEALRSRGRATVPRRVAVAGGVVAERLEGTAYWLRANDLTDLAAVVRQELRTSPGRIALLALGIGFLLGRASRR